MWLPRGVCLTGAQGRPRARSSSETWPVPTREEHAATEMTPGRPACEGWPMCHTLSAAVSPRVSVHAAGWEDCVRCVEDVDTPSLSPPLSEPPEEFGGPRSSGSGQRGRIRE